MSAILSVFLPAFKKQWVRSGPDSLPESNRAVVNPNLHVWCFGSLCQTPRSRLVLSACSANPLASQRVEGEETDGRGHPNTQVPRLLWCLASRYNLSSWRYQTERLEGFLKAETHCPRPEG